MKAFAANLLSIIKGSTVVILIHQHAYSWQIPQCDKLLTGLAKTILSQDISLVVYLQ
jgi:hypothetical protein